MSDPPLDIHQNPLYPRDANLTPDEFNAMVRAASMRRAISPGELICQIDNTSTDNVPLADHDATHEYQELMDFRHGKVIADSDPWTYWQLYDVWAGLQNPPAPMPPPVPKIVGWYPRVIVHRGGIPFMEGQDSGWIGYTFATQILPQRIWPQSNGTMTRVTFMGYPMGFNFAYIGPIGLKQWVANQFFQLTVNGIGSFSTNPQTLTVTTDPLPFGLDGSRGWIISGIVATGGMMGVRISEPGFSAKEHYGDTSSKLDKSGADYQLLPYSDAGILSVEGYYPEPGVVS
jgi:hypothetical protein